MRLGTYCICAYCKEEYLKGQMASEHMCQSCYEEIWHQKGVLNGIRQNSKTV